MRTRQLSRAPSRTRPERGRISKILCLDCNVNTDCIHEYYVVTDTVWARVMPGSGDGFLSTGCLELRLGCELAPADLIRDPINTDPHTYRPEWLRIGQSAMPVYRLLDARATHERFPETFAVPGCKAIAAMKAGDFAMLCKNGRKLAQIWRRWQPWRATPLKQQW
jgi:hypothetical protein